MSDGTDDSNDSEPKIEFDLSDIAGLNAAETSTPEPALPEAPEIPTEIPTEVPTELSGETPAESFPELSTDLAPSSDSPSDADPSDPMPVESMSADAAETVITSGDPIEKLRAYSEQIPLEKVQVPAAFPFSLLIEGELSPEEREKLLDVLSRENFGIREVDLEPQFECARVLIPRISEYAGVLLVQALRGTRARMRLGPSDSIFSTEDTHASSDPLQHRAAPDRPEMPSQTPLVHPAELVAITTEASLPQLGEFDVIDTLVASSLLESSHVEAESSSEYQTMLENLMRELKYKAYRKGAVGLLQFRVELQKLTLATQYRLLVTAIAIRPRSADVSKLSEDGDSASSAETPH